MEKIDKGNGVFELRLADNSEPIYWGCVNYNTELRELSIPEGAKVIADQAFCFCSGLTKVYMPASIEKLGHAVFYGVRQRVEIIYAGTAEQFLKLAKPYQKVVSVQVPGEYDVQPYCCTEGTYYEDRLEWRYFDAFCAKCQVTTADGQTLYYGFARSE